MLLCYPQHCLGIMSLVPSIKLCYLWYSSVDASKAMEQMMCLCDRLLETKIPFKSGSLQHCLLCVDNTGSRFESGATLKDCKNMLSSIINC